MQLSARRPERQVAKEELVALQAVQLPLSR